MKPSLSSLGEDALLVDFGIDRHEQAVALWRGLSQRRPAWCREAVLGDGAVVLHLSTPPEGLEALLEAPPPAGPESRTVEIPVQYGGEGLAEVARLAGRTEDEVVRLHSTAGHLVRFLGFLPGFPYLDGLPEALRLPRLETPRARIPAGSVAIAGGRTGIYPFGSPGGWRVLGKTDLVLFDPRRDPLALLAPGDRVRFMPL